MKRGLFLYKVNNLNTNTNEKVTHLKFNKLGRGIKPFVTKLNSELKAKTI